jgi:hypothetical protein
MKKVRSVLISFKADFEPNILMDFSPLEYNRYKTRVGRFSMVSVINQDKKRTNSVLIDHCNSFNESYGKIDFPSLHFLHFIAGEVLKKYKKVPKTLVLGPYLKVSFAQSSIMFKAASHSCSVMIKGGSAIMVW